MKTGFTLIELLVVVLIIGILAAVAMPQYTRAVEKSRVAEAKTMLRSIAQAQDVYMLENTTAASDFADLDITVTDSKNYEFYLEEDIGPGTYALAAGRKNGEYGVYYTKGYGEDGKFFCMPYDSADKGCQVFGKTLRELNGTGWQVLELQ